MHSYKIKFDKGVKPQTMEKAAWLNINYCSKIGYYVRGDYGLGIWFDDESIVKATVIKSKLLRTMYE